MITIAAKTIGLLERNLMKSATVLAVRAWEPDSFREIDLHMPDGGMNDWRDAQHIKCKVGPLTYRDYTPAGWDEETRTCTLYIDAGHDGPGADWAKSLKQGDAVYYRGPSSSHQRPQASGKMFFLGDESAIGHFFALQQLAGPGAKIGGAVVISDSHHREEFSQYFGLLGLEALAKSADGGYGSLGDWVGALPSPAGVEEEAVFYLAGHSGLMAGLRKKLRQKGYEKIRAQGFWD